ncbi:MAG TPA: ribbon-helix-helix domain-containing protein [Coxiellaceae bacterium]|nr:ribbon-helix-helix domain-containing protein [Coxiellaceae bacterium]
MNINIYIEDQLGNKLNTQAKLLGKKRNALIREAIRYWLLQRKASRWPQRIRQFHGNPSFSRFNTDRDDLTPAKDDPFK